MENLRWSLFSPGDTLLVAVSGGPDSLSLLHVLHTQRDALGLASLAAAHLDHGLRGKESAAEAVWVADWCAERSIPCIVGEVNVALLAKTRKCSKQEAARSARYDFLDAAGAAIGAHKIATAHTQDDQVETVLLNILRGTGLDGLRGIPAQRGLYVRPLLGVSRAAIEAYCHMHGLEPRRDPSNLTTDRYTRNRIRLDLLPQLTREYNPAVNSALLRLSEIAARDSDYLHIQAQDALSDATVEARHDWLALRRSALEALHPALLRAVLRTAITEVRGTAEGITHQHIERLAELALQTLDGETSIRRHRLFPFPHCDVALRSDLVILARTAPQPSAPTCCRWKLQTSAIQPPGSCWAEVDADKVDFKSLTARGRQAGDKIATLGMGGKHKKLSDLFIDAKVPRAERVDVPIVTDAAGLVWVVGYALADRVKVAATTTRTLFLTVTPEEEYEGESDLGRS